MQLSPRQSLWFVVALVTLTLLAYAPTMSAGFIWDDDDYVINNETLRDLDGLGRIWTDPSATPQYYPFVHSTFWLEYQAWGLAAPGYHIVNVLIHTLNSLLVWRLCQRLEIPAAWLVGLLFAIHPVHVESVAWITERKNVLSGLFYLSAAYTYLCYTGIFSSTDPSPPAKATWKLYALSLILFVAALLSKTVTSTLPAALLVVIWWKQGTIPRWRLWNLAPMFAIGIGFGLLTVWLEKHHVGAAGMDWELSFVERCLIAGRAICFYAGKLLVPMNLIFTYPRWEIDATSIWQFSFPAGVLIAIVGLYLLRNRVGRGPVAAVCFFSGTLFPALGFFDVYPMRFSFVADHFQYLASIGMLVLYVQIGVLVWQRLLGDNESARALTSIVVCGALTLLLFSLTWKQTLIYNDIETLWRDTLARNPTSWMAHNNLGALLNRRGDFAAAETHLRESVRLKPDFAESLSNLGKSREGQGDITGATELYERAVRMSPTDAKLLNNLGAIYGATGRLDDARRILERALQSNPKFAGVYGNLGSVHASQGDIEPAIENYKRCLELDPAAIEIRVNLARILIQKTEFSAAHEQLQLALQQDPQHIGALLNLGIVYVNQERLTAAAEVFEKLVRIQPTNMIAMQNLAYTYQQLGLVEKADAIAAEAARLQRL